MEKKDVKEELLKRYKYFYENAGLILGPYYKNCRLNLPTNLIEDLEISFLSEIRLEDTNFYKEFEKQKEDKNYLEKANAAIKQQKKDSWGYSFPPELDLWTLIFKVREYIKDQSGDLDNKKVKIDVLDEYFRLRRYENNGRIWTSGYNYTFEDIKNNLFNGSYPIRKELEPTRKKHDVGVKSNIFLNTIYNRDDKKYVSYFSEEEKQNVYLSLHDELPWNLTINCSHEENEEDKLERPNNTKPCSEDFYVKEEEIFMSGEEYYQRCTNCGYIVNIPKEILSLGIKERIDNSIKSNPDLERYNVLKSELESIENKGKTKALTNKN